MACYNKCPKGFIDMENKCKMPEQYKIKFFASEEDCNDF